MLLYKNFIHIPYTYMMTPRNTTKKNKPIQYPSYRDITFEKAVKNKEKWEAIINSNEPYICPKCGIAKPTSEFGVQYMKNDIIWSYRWLYECLECKKTRIANKRLYSSNTVQWAIQTIYKNILQASRKQNMACDLAEKDIQAMWDKQDGKCYYTAYPMTYNLWLRKDSPDAAKYYVTLDKKNPDWWFSKNNCVLCCSFVHKMKNSLNDKEFLQVCKDVIINFS